MPNSNIWPSNSEPPGLWTWNLCFKKLSVVLLHSAAWEMGLKNTFAYFTGLGCNDVKKTKHILSHIIQNWELFLVLALDFPCILPQRALFILPDPCRSSDFPYCSSVCHPDFLEVPQRCLKDHSTQKKHSSPTNYLYLLLFFLFKQNHNYSRVFILKMVSANLRKYKLRKK